MKYTVQTIKYIVKNFLYLFPFVILPSVFLSLALDKPTVKQILTGHFSGNPKASFPDFFHAISILNLRSLASVIFGLAGVVLMVFCCAMMFALMEKHMRIGKRTFNGIFGKINENLLCTCGICLLMTAVYELWALLSSALLAFVAMIGNVTVVYVLSAVIYLAMNFLLMFVLSFFYLWLPTLQITGLRPFEALKYSYELLEPVRAKTVFAQSAHLLLSQVLLGAVAVFVPGEVASMIVAAVLYAILMLMFCARMLVVYFDRSETERADLKKYYHF